MAFLRKQFFHIIYYFHPHSLTRISFRAHSSFRSKINLQNYEKLLSPITLAGISGFSLRPGPRGRAHPPRPGRQEKPQNTITHKRKHPTSQFCKFTFLSSFRSPPPRANHHSNHDPSHRRADPFQIQAVQWQSI